MVSENVIQQKTDVKKLEESLIALNHAFRKHQDFIKTRFKISALEMELIQFVINNGPQKMKAISENFHIKLSTLTSIIDKAENARILKRTNSREDRRVVFLDTTKKGRKIYDEYSQFLRETALRMRANLAEVDFGNFVEGMETFTKISVPETAQEA